MSSEAISVVVPVYASHYATLHELVTRIRSTLAGSDFEVVLIDDGSPRTTWEACVRLSQEFSFIRAIGLARNVGQHSALLAGVRIARHPICITIDDDLQNPPEEIPLLVQRLSKTEADVVYGLPVSVQQNAFRRLSSSLIRKGLVRTLGVSQAPEFSSFRCFRTALREAFAGPLGPNISLDALLTWATSNYSSCQVRHAPRKTGSSGYSLQRLLRFGFDTVTGYTTKPLQFASFLGLLTSFFGFVALVWVVARPLVEGSNVPGFPFLAATIALFSGVQLFSLGVFGEYLARMHFRLMGKPSYTIMVDTGKAEI